MDFSSIEAAVKVLKTMIYALIALLLVIVFLGFYLYVQSNTIDKLNLSLTGKQAELFGCRSQNVTLSSALDEQTRKVQENKIDKEKAKENVAKAKPLIQKRYKDVNVEENASCEAKIKELDKVFEVWYAGN